MKRIYITLIACCCLSVMMAQTTRIYQIDKLAKVKAKKTEQTYRPAMNSLIKAAEKAMAAECPSVMDKTMTAQSGDKHDYMSMGPYWWPDPTKPDGLPYIRKDGQRNPELEKLDRKPLDIMSKAVVTLGLAYYFTDKEEYADKAVEYLKTWFLNEETKMNPHLNYGQTIPGKRNGLGRGTGLIDTYCFIEMLDALALMENAKAMTPEVKKGMKEWFTAFVSWMTDSSVAQEERDAKNNHGLAYDVQLASYALYIGNNKLAEKVVKKFPETRLYPQIEPDGKQPLELERTTAFGYTLFNLGHMLEMAQLARTLNIDLYHATSKDGRSITAAIRFILPYIGKPQSEWPYQQIKDWEKKQDEATWMLRKASFFDPEAGYEEIGAQFRTTKAGARQHLLYSLE